ncbi:LuxR C-terminal-related transcriptional regulator [Roseibacterium sp. SDUM158017]|uniref:LuxR C-terminal-related transcriptional regulator n=1 Tax=Roseicyclus salinarum TaxID=3036773 RepID=UPI002415491A|nr:LuxR C-terminal-related transcriptional regulator [Roseibacterium sp. SDUM158017]MDG4648713.1 LuxR C-terminal-related transcriptional regulator [Roseibacterium sp. SDUM158017]
MTSANEPSLKPARAVEALLGRTFPGHTMQRVRTADGKYRYGYVGSGVKELFALDPQDLMSRPEVDHAWIHPEDRPRFIDALEKSARDLTPLDEEVRVESPSGSYRWVRSIGHPRRQKDHSIIWDGVALDIHDRREALETLSEMLVRVRDSETTEDRFSAIAAKDVHDRLDELRAELAAFASVVTPDQRDGFARIEARLDAVARSVAAANDLAVTVDQSGYLAGLPAEPDEAINALTGRQLEILRLAAEGALNRVIGHRLGLSEGTVKQHMTRIFRRLGVQNRTEAVARLRSAGRLSD